MARNSISAKQPIKLMTGIDALDRTIGGFPNGSVILIQGKVGSGFDIFAQQILYTMASLGECNVLYVTVDRPPDDIESELTARNWDISPLMADKRWEFLDLYTLRLNVRKGVAGPKALFDAFLRIPSLIKEGTWSAVDTLTFVLESVESKDVLGFLDEMVAAAREKGGLHFLLLVEGLHDERLVTSLAHLADGLFTFSLDPQAIEAMGSLRIVKLRKASHVTRLISYRIVDTGIVVETVSRIA